MKNIHLILIILVTVLFQTSCKDFWHPEGPTLDPKADYATITLNRYSAGGGVCNNGVLISVTTGNNYQFKGNVSGEYEPIKVPAGTYYITAVGQMGRNIRSDDFSVSKRGTKTISYYFPTRPTDGIYLDELR
jgi:hypothetical protein